MLSGPTVVAESRPLVGDAMTSVAGAVAANRRNAGNSVAPAPPQLRNDTGGASDAQAAAMAEAERLADEEGVVAVRTQGQYEEKKGKIGKITKKKWYIIDPRSSKIISYWDGIGMVRCRRLEHPAMLAGLHQASCGDPRRVPGIAGRGRRRTRRASCPSSRHPKHPGRLGGGHRPARGSAHGWTTQMG